MNLGLLFTGYNLLLAAVIGIATVLLGWRIGMNQLEKDTIEMLKTQNMALKDEVYKLKRINQELHSVCVFHHEKLSYIDKKEVN